MNKEKLIAIVEAMLFISGDDGVDIEIFKKKLKLSTSEVKNLLIIINEKYKNNNHGITINSYAKTKFRITTLPEYYEYLENIKNEDKTKKLSQSNLEVLSIIAYKGPITKIDIEKIRGVNSDYIINKLKELELISEFGRKNDIIGRPFIYKITEKFMKEFNLNSLSELPKIDMNFDNQIS